MSELSWGVVLSPERCCSLSPSFSRPRREGVMPFLRVEKAIGTLFQSFHAGRVWDRPVQLPASALNVSSDTLQMKDLARPYGELRLEDCTIMHGYSRVVPLTNCARARKARHSLLTPAVKNRQHRSLKLHTTATRPEKAHNITSSEIMRYEIIAIYAYQNSGLPCTKNGQMARPLCLMLIMPTNPHAVDPSFMFSSNSLPGII